MIRASRHSDSDCTYFLNTREDSYSNRYGTQISSGLEHDFPRISLSAHLVVAGEDCFQALHRHIQMTKECSMELLFGWPSMGKVVLEFFVSSNDDL